MKKQTIVYHYKDKIYINLTNKCSNNCEFCIRNGKEKFYDYYLWLDKEPTAQETIKELEKYMDYQNFVFCGFGEPLYALDTIIEAAKYLKRNNKHTRLNTNGQADLIHKGFSSDEIAKKIAGIIDEVSISLNAADAESYQKICHSEFGIEGYASMLRFAKACKENGIKVILTIVDCMGEEQIEKASLIAKKLGAEFRVRRYGK